MHRIRANVQAGLAVVLLVLAALLPARAVADEGAAPYAQRPTALQTPWTRSVSTVAPLPDYPRPQLERSRWQSLNGRWQYEQSTVGQPPPFGQTLAETILVPYPVQSPLGGIGRGDTSGWYERTFTVPASWAADHVMLNFGAVAWSATVYVNGQLAGTHQGDYTSFSFDITALIHRGATNQVLVGFYDPVGGAGEPVGKQVPVAPYAYYHSASAGIWQTVWLEPVAADHLTDLDLRPDLSHDRLIVTAATSQSGPGGVVAEAMAGGRVVARATGRPGRPFALTIPHPREWSPDDPYLYGLRVRLTAGATTIDRAQSYFGMRSVRIGRVRGQARILLNGRFVFETGAMTQGFWPDGLYTAPTDSALRFDLLTARRLGYNMIREHAKVEPDRWYYWADRIGILVWQDIPNLPIAGHPPPTPAGEAEFRADLRAIVVQHRSDPSVVMWIPFNEGWDQFDVTGITRTIDGLDPSVLVDSNSGAANCCNALGSSASDVRDAHLYSGPFAPPAGRGAAVIGEYGGEIPYPPHAHAWPGVLTSLGAPVLAWGPGIIIPMLRQQYRLLDDEMRLRGLSGAVFTELTSAEQELGIVTYDRRLVTIAPPVLARLNRSLINDSEQPPAAAPPPAVPLGTSALWRFDEGHGTSARDATGHGHKLALRDGAGWTGGVHGRALALGSSGQVAVSSREVIDTRRSFTVSAWLRLARGGQSSSAVSEPGAHGSSFVLGVQTASQGGQSISGEVGRRPVLSPGIATWWTFAVPLTRACTIAQCGMAANLRYDDGRGQPQPGRWYHVTGVYSVATHTITIYVDGIPEDTEHGGPLPAAQGPLTVGAGTADFPQPASFDGAVDDLRVYGRALSPPEVWQLYRAERR